MDKNQGTAFELVSVYLRGWREGACEQTAAEEIAENSTRPDVAGAYMDGYAAGMRARVVAEIVAAERFGYRDSKRHKRGA